MDRAGVDRAVAKIDMRLVPDMKAADALAALKAHLAKRGFGDIEVNMTGVTIPQARLLIPR
jgi:acetylornithine deacetylase/succinyl-diaminopimelate desuccinylase-like protein